MEAMSDRVRKATQQVGLEPGRAAGLWDPPRSRQALVQAPHTGSGSGSTGMPPRRAAP